MYLKNLRAVGGSLLTCLLLFSASYTDVWAKETSVKRPPPPTPVLPIGDNFFCSAVLGSSLYTDDANDSWVKGTLFDGTDRITIKVEGDKLRFLTQASFELGDVGDESPFDVLINDDGQVVAIDYDVVGKNASTNVFALNRKTGIAVWSKSRSKGLLTLNPDVQSYVLGCESR